MPTLYTLGYLQRGSMERLRKLVADNVIVLDVRYSPRSAHPQWSKGQLAERFGSSYLHVPEFGNVNYRSPDLPIELLHEEFGVWAARFWLEKGYDICLLCACADVSTCHRLKAAALVEAASACTVVHL